jgi:hypothetical protein
MGRFSHDYPWWFAIYVAVREDEKGGEASPEGRYLNSNDSAGTIGHPCSIIFYDHVHYLHEELMGRPSFSESESLLDLNLSDVAQRDLCGGSTCYPTAGKL